MATTSMIWESLITQMQTAFAGTNPLVNLPATLPPPEIGIDWPAQKCIGAVSANQQQALISVFDRGATKNITQAIPLMNVFPDQAVAHPGAVLTSSSTFLAPSGVITLTGSGTTIINDAYCLTLISGIGGSQQLFAEYTALLTDTLSTALTAFTAKINLLDGITASLTGSVITVTNNNTPAYTVRSEVTNIATITMEGYRWLRDIQVTLWTPTPATRSKYGDVLELLFTQLEVNYGFITSDNSACRLTVTHDHIWTDSQLQDYYRRDFIIKIDYPVLNTIPAWPIETTQQTYGILT